MNSKHDDKHADRLKSLDRLAAKVKSTSTSTTPANSMMARENLSKAEEEKAKMEQEMNAIKEKIDVQKKEAEEVNGYVPCQHLVPRRVSCCLRSSSYVVYQV